MRTVPQLLIALLLAMGLHARSLQAQSCIEQVTDGGFETGTPSTSWSESSTNFGTPLCDLIGCGDGDGTAGPRTGDFWVWFGGFDDGLETGSISQNVTLPGPNATLVFYLWIGFSSGNGQDFLRVTVDGNQVFFVLEGNPAFAMGYRLVSIDLSAFADGGAHELAFESTTFGGGLDILTNFSVDDISLQTCSGSTATTGYHTLSPCRVVDTRLPDGPLGGPALGPGQDRLFVLAGACGIPLTAKAVSLNIAVTGSTAPGNIRLHPGGTLVPATSSINFAAGQTRSNNAIIILDSLGRLAAFAAQASGTVHIILDVNGYFE